MEIVIQNLNGCRVDRETGISIQSHSVDVHGLRTS